ncbi:MAG: nicotinate phosphoribosyltransferase [Acholeplasmatales bacterium]|jgi:nicotinate phosphoribosyltransferase|nr:nicotinate phosphoribosyltransferase [Acholeplasmatales bacterium]
MDYYELTMCYSYFLNKKHHELCVFDVFFRGIPDGGGYAIFCGLEDIVDYIKNLSFSAEEITFLRNKKQFNEEFLNYLQNFKFQGDLYSFKEGSVMFPMEPIITVKGNLIECQLIETYLLTIFNHQSLIATKSLRIVRAAKGRSVMEFGARRAQGSEAAIKGARASYIAGCIGSSNTLDDYLYGIPALGTMAHSYVMSFESEYEAFKCYSLTYPDNSLLLVDTYNTLKSGVPNAIKVHNEVLKPLGKRLKGIRIDSGDLAYLTQKARLMLDNAGLQDCKITVSNSLDEYLITSLIEQGAKIDSFGVGERLITARSEPVFGGVYKISMTTNQGKLVPTIKLSDNPIKTTTPGFKKVYRLYDVNHQAIADLVTLQSEEVDETKPYLLFDPFFIYKQKQITNFSKELKTVLIFKEGKLVYQLPTLQEIKNFTQKEVDALWPEVKRLENPQEYYVDLSQELWDLKENLLKKYQK